MNIHFKTAVSYVRRAPFQVAAAIFVLSLTFFVATLVSVIVYSSNRVISYFETRPQVIVFLKDEAKGDDIQLLQKNLNKDDRLKDIKYVSKEDALSIYKKSTSGNPLLGELVSPSIFPASLEFSVKDLNNAQTIIDEVKKDPIVDSVGFTAALGSENDLKGVVNKLKSVTSYIRFGGLVFTGILVAASFMVILVTISLRMTTRREEIEILKLIGATQGFIRNPILIEAMIYALTGVFIGWILSFIGVLYSAPAVVSYFGEIPVLPSDTLKLIELFGIILGCEIIFGFILAFSGSFLAISRAKKVR